MRRNNFPKLYPPLFKIAKYSEYVIAPILVLIIKVIKFELEPNVLNEIEE